jgi:hypothetical protein
VAVEPDHGRTHQPSVDFTHEEQLRLRCELARYVGMWVIPWTGETGLLPQRYDSSLIGGAKGTDFHVRDDA